LIQVSQTIKHSGLACAFRPGKPCPTTWRIRMGRKLPISRISLQFLDVSWLPEQANQPLLWT